MAEVSGIDGQRIEWPQDRNGPWPRVWAALVIMPVCQQTFLTNLLDAYPDQVEKAVLFLIGCGYLSRAAGLLELTESGRFMFIHRMNGGG